MVVSLALGAIRMKRAWRVLFSTVIPWRESGEKRERKNEKVCVYTHVCVYVRVRVSVCICTCACKCVCVRV